MPLFKVPKRANDKAVAKKSKSKTRQTTTTIRGGSGLLCQINQIKAMVEKNLGQFKDDYLVIRTESDLTKYIDEVIKNGVVAIDTETTGLDQCI